MGSFFVRCLDPENKPINLERFAKFFDRNVYLAGIDDILGHVEETNATDVAETLDDSKMYGYFVEGNVYQLFHFMAILRLFAGANIKLVYYYCENMIYYYDLSKMQIVVGFQDDPTYAKENKNRCADKKKAVKCIEDGTFPVERILSINDNKKFQNMFRKDYMFQKVKHLLFFISGA